MQISKEEKKKGTEVHLYYSSLSGTTGGFEILGCSVVVVARSGCDV